MYARRGNMYATCRRDLTW